MKIPLELRFAILLSLLVLLWLTLEYMVGLHDKYIRFHPFVTTFGFLVVVGWVMLRAEKEKRAHLNGITFKQALISGLIIAAISAVLAVPVQFTFHYLINPDYFDTMIDYTVNHATTPNVEEVKANAQMYFNLPAYIVQSAVMTLITGVIAALIVAFVVKTPAQG